MAVTAVGSVYVDVVPSARNFVRDMVQQMGLDDVDKIGREIGERIGAEASRRVTEGIEDGVQRARPGKAATRKGKEAADAFGRAFKAEIRAALASLPDIELESNPEGVLADIALIRAELKSLGDKRIGVDLSGEGAVAQAAALRVLLEGLRDQKIDVDVDFDVDGAIRSLGQLERQIADRAGGAFDRSLRSSLRNAVDALPEVLELNLDTDRGSAALALLRAQLAEFSALADIDLNIDADSALADVARISAELQAIVDDEDIDVRVRVDAAAAIAGLSAVTAAARALDREIEVEVTADRRALDNVIAEIAALRDLEIGIDLSEDEALRGLARLRAELVALQANATDLNVRLAIKPVLRDIAELEGVLGALEAEEVEIPVKVKEPNLGAFLTKLRADLLKIESTLPEIQIDADTSPAMREVRDIRIEIGRIAASITVDTDVAAALAKLAALQARAKAIDQDTITVQVDADVAAAIAQLGALAAATATVGQAADVATARLSRMRLILALIFALVPLIAGAILALSSVIALVVTPIAAVAAGIDGIKSAVEPLNDELASLKEATSAAFEAGLQPAVENVAELFPVLEDGLVGTAFALSDVAEGVTDVVSESRNLDTIAGSFDLINQIITASIPSVQSLTQNMIDLTNIGAQGLVGFGEEMRQVGQAFADVIARLNESGTAQAAVRALFQVIAELLNLLAPLTEFGAVIATSFGPALAAALSIAGAAFGAFADVLDSLPPGLQEIASIATVVIGVLLLLGRTGGAIAVAFRAMVVGALAASGALATAGAAAVGFGRLLLAAFGGPIGLAITGLIVLLSFLGQSQSDAAAAADEHRSTVQELASALRDSGGAIDANILALTRQKLETVGAIEAAEELGLSQVEVAKAVADGGPAFEGLRDRLTQIIAANTGTVTTGKLLDQSFADNAASAEVVLTAITGLRQGFVDAAEENRLYAEGLRQLGFSMVGGLANAQTLEAAFIALGDASSSTSDKVKALDDALNALSGGTLTAEEAAAQLEEAIDGIGEAFEAAQKASRETGAALIDATGGIDKTTEAGRKLFDATLEIRDGMLEAATASFDAAGGLGNIEQASAAAGQKVQSARDAFIKAAQAAGINATEAERLANRYGLIPDLVTTLLRAEGVPQVQQELQQVLGRLNTLPPNTEIRVTALSNEALTVLHNLGIEVEQLEDGSFKIFATDETKPTIEAALGFVAQQQGNLPVDADASPLERSVAVARANAEVISAKIPLELKDDGVGAALALVGTQAAATTAEVPLTANSTAVPPVLDAVSAAVGRTPAEVPITGNASQVPVDAAAAAGQVAAGPPAQLGIAGDPAKLNADVAAIRGQVQAQQTLLPITLSVSGEITGLYTALSFARSAVENSTFTARIAGDTGLLTDALARARSSVEGTTATMRISAEYTQALSVLGIIRDLINAATGTMKIDATAALAQAKLSAILSLINLAVGVIRIDANTRDAEAKLAALTRPRTVTITANVVGGIPNAAGNLIPAGFAFAEGGSFPGKAKEMRANWASIVPPRTYRMIGDRARGDELYLPLNNSDRSESLLAIGAARMGFGLVPMASGGLLTLAESVLRLAQGVRGGISTQSTGAFANAQSQINNARSQLNALGGNSGTVEQKLDQLIEAVNANSGPSSITVEDRSGNPVETARATVLAMKLKR